MAARGRTEQAREGRVCLGAIAGAYGVKGAVRIKSFTAEPKDVGSYGRLFDESGEREFEIKVTGMSKAQVLAEIEGVTDRMAAEALKGVGLYIPRERLPAPEEEEYYYDDLVGLGVEGADGVALGEVIAVHDFGAGDVIEVRRKGAVSVMVPFTSAVVPVVDLAAGRLVIDPPPGLLEPVTPGPDNDDDDDDGETA